MSGETPYAGATWWFEVAEFDTDGGRVTGATVPTPTVAYAATLDGAAVSSGAVPWDAARGTWRVSLVLPTPAGATGRLRLKYTGTTAAAVGVAYDALTVRRA